MMPFLVAAAGVALVVYGLYLAYQGACLIRAGDGYFAGFVVMVLGVWSIGLGGIVVALTVTGTP